MHPGPAAGPSNQRIWSNNPLCCLCVINDGVLQVMTLHVERGVSLPVAVCVCVCNLDVRKFPAGLPGKPGIMEMKRGDKIRCKI